MPSPAEVILARAEQAPDLAIELVWVRRSSGDATGGGMNGSVERRFAHCPEGTTLAEAVESHVPPQQRRALAEGRLTVAIFGERRARETRLQNGDRIELLEPLLADPKQSRARRAQVQRSRKGDARWEKR
jgi:putative ubiquitin-RnfH superfamily antitoxin RatB of RatAB toxin-antitoxin module